MKNKGRKQTSNMDGNCKGNVMHITRPIESMSSKGMATGKFDKKKWSKRVRGYNKTSAQSKLID